MAGTGKKIGVLSLLMVIAVGLVGLLAVFILVPILADAAGLSVRSTNYAVAGAAFLVAVVVGRWVKSLTKKSSERN